LGILVKNVEIKFHSYHGNSFFPAKVPPIILCCQYHKTFIVIFDTRNKPVSPFTPDKLLLFLGGGKAWRIAQWGAKEGGFSWVASGLNYKYHTRPELFASLVTTSSFAASW
jgi:hypothetical protein